jgi:Carbohydrate family 9 binding domain-like/BNR/Asp-box repeat
MKRLPFKLALLGVALVMLVSACSLPGFATPTPFPTLDLNATATAIASQLEASLPTPTGLPPTAMPPTPALPTQSPAAFPTVSSPALVYMNMIDATNGWGLTSQEILRTRDGGASWENVTPGGGFGAGVSLRGFFLDVTHGWVVVPSADFTTGTLYRTFDQGQTWQSAAVPFGGGDLQFLDEQNGWVMVGTGAGAGSSSVDIYQTTDSGNSWNKVYSLNPDTSQNPGNLPFAGSKNGMAFRDTSYGWVGGTEPMDGYVWLFISQDGGKTWNHQDLTLPAGFEQAQTSIDAPIFFNNQDGVLPVGLYSSDTVAKDFYVTTDGGITWRSTQVVENQGLYSVSSMLDFWVWDGVKFSSSHDGGQTWNTFNPSLNLKDIISGTDFVDKNNGWATSMDANGQGQLYMTPNGGLTWIIPSTVELAPTGQPVTQPTTPTLTPIPTTAAVAPLTRPGASVTATYMSAKPTIDGNLDEWNLTRYPVEDVVFGESNWVGLKDCSGQVMLGYDNQNLYIAAQVTDEAYVQNASGKNQYKGDSVEIQLDTNLQGDYYVQTLSDDDFQIGLSGGNASNAPQAYLWYPDRLEGLLGTARIGFKLLDGGYVIEAAVPWGTFGITPQAGQTYGFAFSISDNDNPDQNVQQSLISNVSTRMLTNPTTWGNLALK